MSTQSTQQHEFHELDDATLTTKKKSELVAYRSVARRRENTHVRSVVGRKKTELYVNSIQRRSKLSFENFFLRNIDRCESVLAIWESYQTALAAASIRAFGYQPKAEKWSKPSNSLWSNTLLMYMETCFGDERDEETKKTLVVICKHATLLYVQVTTIHTNQTQSTL